MRGGELTNQRTLCTTHGRGQQHGDWLGEEREWERGSWGGGEAGEEEKKQEQLNVINKI